MNRYLYAFLCIGLALLLPILTIAQPVANFTANATSGCSPIVVQFTDQSTGTPTSWYWDLGNGTTSTIQNPSTTYLNPGTYTVSLVATNGGGNNTMVKTNYITVYPSPVVNFYGDSTLSCPPKTVAFTNTSVAGGSGTVTYLWDFGDGNTSTSANPTHTYTTSGNFSVTLIITNGSSCTKSLTKANYIPVAPKPAIAFTAAATSSCRYPFTASFTNATTNAVSYNWNFGDGGTSTATSPTHTYTTSGTYTVRLIATSSFGCIDTLTKTSYISVGPLHAAMSVSPSTACANQNVYFTNTSSTANVTWQFGDATVSNSTNPVHVYSTPGTYTAKVIAIDGTCYDTAQQIITVSSSPSIQFTASPTDGCSIPFTTVFTNSTTNAASYYWIFGDGGTSTSANPSHTYTSYGNYTVRLGATSASGCTDTLTKTSYIKVQTPTASLATNNYNGCAPATVIFTPTITTNIPVSYYSWDFGDGSSIVACSTCSSPTHIYTTSGIYTATLTYTTGTGCVYTATKTITVPTKPTASFTGSPLVVCPGQVVTYSNTSTGATSYYWNFGDGSASTLTNPSYAYGAGVYTISLIADNNGCRDTMIRTNYITVNLPRASFSPSYSCSNRFSYVFTDNSIGANTYSWNFGDGGTSTASGNASHTYAAYGAYNVTLTVTNTSTGCSSTYQKTIQVYPLTTSFSANDTTICKGDSIVFAGTTNTVISNYAWNFGDSYTATGSSNIAGHRYNTSGIYTAKLVVSDTANCKDSLIKTSYIRVGGPTVDFSGSPTTGCPTLNVNFTDLSTTNAGFALVTRTWAFGDASTNVTAASTISHAYPTAGTYNVTLTVTDANGCNVGLTKTNYITVSKPVPQFSTADTNACLGQSVTFTNTSTGTGISSLWSFGDGGTSTAASPSHAYAATGNYTVKLVVTESGGCKDSLIRTNYIHVGAPAIAFSLSDTFAACPPLVVNCTNSSTGASTYTWSFGNGGTSSLTNPSTVYTYPGTYSVKLIGQNSTGCKDSLSKTVIIQGPTGSFSYSPLAGCTPLTVNFSSTTNNTTTLIWDLNNGYTQNTTSSTLAYTYTTTGKFVPKLILSDGGSCLVPVQGVDTIKADHVDADFSFTPNNFCNSGTVQFTDTATSTISAISSRSWDFGDAGTSTAHNPSHLYTGPGTYTVRLIIGNAQGCLDTVIKTVTIYALPNVTAASNQSICQGSTTPVSISATGATSYVWSPAGSLSCSNCANPTALPASTTTYVVTGTDAHGCTDTGNVTITVNAKPVIGASASQTICEGNSVTLGATGGTSYSWSPSTGLSCTACTNPVATPATTTTYIVTGSNAAGCSDTESVTITVNPRPLVGAGSNVSICSGDSAPLNATGAVSYVWSPSTGLSCTACANPTATPASTTTYTVTGTGANGCINTATVTVTVNSRPTVGAGSNQSICIGNSVTLTATGASSYVWSPTTGLSCSNCASPVASPTGTTTYTVTGTGANGCTNTSNVTVTVNPLPNVSAGANQTTCPNIPVSLSATGATTYVWSPSTGLSCTACANPTATISTTTTYTVTGTNGNGCVNTSNVTVTVNPQPNVSAGSNTTVCIGDSVQLNASGGVTYSWSPSTGLSCTTCQNPKASPGVTTTYTVTGTVGTGCSNTSTVTVTANVKPTVGAGSNQTICIGGSATLTGTGAVSYVWSPATGLSCTACANPLASPASTTTYTVTGTAANGCTNNSTATVTVNSLPTVNVGANQTVCAGGSASLLASGAVSYVWSPSAGLSCTACANPTATPPVTTTYTVTGTNSNGCTNTSTVTVTVNPLPTVSAGSNATICFGDSATLSASGGVSYVWSPVAGLSCTTCQNPKASPGITTTYTVTGTGSNGCINTSTVIVTVNPRPAVNAGSNQNICIGSSATLTATGGVSYVWSPATGLSCTACASPTASPTTTTVYTVTGTGSNGCTNTSTVNVNVNPLPNVSAGANQITCPNVPVSLLATGATTYVWSPSTGLSCTACANPTATISLTTTYTVTGTNSNGCVNTSSVTVTVNPQPNISAGSNTAICIGDTAQLNATGGITYSWSPSTGLSCTTCDNPKATPGITTTYTVTGTVGTGCSNTSTVTVTVNPLPAVSAGSNQTICIGGSATLSATGAVSYVWTPATGLSCTACASPVASPTTTTTYTVTGTNANGCKNTSTVTVNVNPLPVVNAGANQTICPGGSAPLLATGAVSYVWSPATGLSCTACANPNATPALTTTYTVTGTNANGCVNTSSVTITVNPQPTIGAGSNTSICIGDTAQLNATGGISYVWSPAAGLTCTACANPKASPAVTTTYTVTGTGANGCTNTSNVTVTVNLKPTVGAGSNQSICIGSSTTLTGSGASSYVWSPSTGLSCTACASPVASPTTTTTYTVTGTNGTGCTNTATVTVTVNPLPLVSAGSNQNICPGTSTPLLATGAVTYVWSPAAGLSCTACANPTASPTATTTYTVTGTNANGCVNTSTVTITVIAKPTVSGGPNKNICIGGNTSLLASGASTYTWSPAAGLSCTSCANPTANPVTTTTYTVIGVSGNGCADTAQVLVTVNSLPVVSAGPNKNICIGSSTTLTASGASTYVWSPTPTLSCTGCVTTTATPPVTTIYTVTGTDGNGCSNTATVTVNVFPIPTISVSGKDSVCLGDTTQLIATGATTYTWTPSTGLSCTACANPIANPLVNTTYTVTGTANGCSGTKQHSIKILQLPVVSAGSDQFICVGNSATLHASGANTYTWTPASGLSCTNCPDPVASPTSTTTYIVTGTNGIGCSDTGLVNVVVNPSPDVFAGNDTTLCYGQPFQLSAKGASVYTWSPGTYLSCTNCPDPVIVPKAKITYKLIGIDINGCSDSDDVVISVKEKGPVSAGPDDTLCVGKSVQLHASGGSDYIWSPAGSLDNNTSSDPMASPLASTTYTVIIKQGVCFADTEEVHVVAHDNPVVSLGPDKTVVYGSIVQLNAEGNDITKYIWDNTEGLSCYDCAKPTATPTKNSTYAVTVYNQWGCEGKDDINIYLTCDQNEVFIANTFTPNKDGSNDKFFPQGKGISAVKRFSVFNRWGQLVYEVKDVKLNDPMIGWDGTFNNEPLKPDVFVYLLIANCITGEPIEIKGDVSLIR